MYKKLIFYTEVNIKLKYLLGRTLYQLISFNKTILQFSKV